MPDIGSEVKAVPSWEEEGQLIDDNSDETSDEQAQATDVQDSSTDDYSR